MRIPAKPPFGSMKRIIERARAQSGRGDGFVRETFTLPRLEARAKAQEWFERWPPQAYWTEIENWRERPNDVIEFTMRRLVSAD